MKTIGLIGGMSWESSLEYYRILNEAVKARLGGFHSAKCVMASVDFAPVEEMQRSGDWETMGEMLAGEARALERAGAGCVLLCTNTMHKVAPAIEAAVRIPFLHIADAAAGAIRARGMTTIGLLGTRFTMEEDFYTARLRDRFGLQALIPSPQERETVHRVIFDELVKGAIRPESREAYRRIIAGLVERGAEGILLGCTEIGLLVKDGDAAVPLFDTTRLHALAAIDWAFEE